MTTSQPALSPIKLVTRDEDSVNEVRSLCADLLRLVTEDECISIAAVVIRKDGSCIDRIWSTNDRLKLIGALVDLQGSLVRNGV